VVRFILFSPSITVFCNKIFTIICWNPRTVTQRDWERTGCVWRLRKGHGVATIMNDWNISIDKPEQWRRLSRASREAGRESWKGGACSRSLAPACSSPHYSSCITR
jgi:hypothetical protein